MAGFGESVFFLSAVTVLTVCISGSAVDVRFQQEHLDRIEALEEQGREQTLMLKTQAALLKKMESKLEDQDEKLLSQEDTIKDYKKKVRDLERTVAELQVTKDNRHSEDSRKIQQRVNDVPSISKEQQPIKFGAGKVVTKQRRLLDNDEGPVAFHAVIKTLNEVAHIGENQNIVFPDIMINLGGGYHNLHGVFIAPKPGIYIFSTSIMSYVNAHAGINVHLMKNGQVVANAFAHGNSGRPDQGSVTVVTQLVAGDEVWVSMYRPADTSLWGYYFDSFMGCLVVPA